MNKFYLLSIAILMSLNLTANELDWVDEQVEAIKPARIGLDFSEISNIKDPFIFVDANGAYKEKKYKKRATKVKKYSNVSSSSSKKSKPKSKQKSKNIYRGSLTLEGIINNSALISGKWYRVNDKVKNFTLAKVSDTSIVLKRNGKKVVLSTNSKNKNLKFKNN